MPDDHITYRYPAPSAFRPAPDGRSLYLAPFTEGETVDEDCLFFGRLLNPEITARCLTTLSGVVRSRFTLSPETIAAMHDPIVSAGSGTVRFEGFSGCAGIYARVDVLPEALDGEFSVRGGTTNVDFNSLMLASLGGVRQRDTVLLSVGSKDVAFGFDSGTVVERKVPLPERWLKGLTSVQAYLAGAEPFAEIGRVQALKLFQGIPRGKLKGDFYLTRRGGAPVLAPLAASGGVAIGGVNRLLLLEPLLAHADCLKIFAHPTGSATTWQLYFGNVRFSFSLSREPYRGFSGEGAGLDDLVRAPAPEAIDALDSLCLANQTFGRDAARDCGIDWPDAATGSRSPEPGLAAMGLLGYDLDGRAYFYRKLPYSPARMLALNPRLKNALKLVADGKVEITYKPDGAIEGHVPGSGVRHTVLLEAGAARCTCAWTGKYGNTRGSCKHILAVRKLVRETDGRGPDDPVQ